MEAFNLIVMRQLIQNHEATRKVAIKHKNAMNNQQQAAYQAAVAATTAGQSPPPEPVALNNTSEEVVRAAYNEIAADEANHPASVEKYDARVERFKKHNPGAGG